jgi:hypothetical protein
LGYLDVLGLMWVKVEVEVRSEIEPVLVEAFVTA